MADTTLLGPWIRRFLLEHLKGERNLALNTRHSYRDALALLLSFLAKDVGQPVDRLKADEAAKLTIRDLDLASSYVKLLGKGNKIRHCPLWPVTTKVLRATIANRDHNDRVFLNRCGRPVTRFGIHTMVERYVPKVIELMPSLAAKQVSPHTIRHTTAVRLLRAGVDINTIRAWLGHVSLDTTNVYAEIDLTMKAKALATCDIAEKTQACKRWREDSGLMSFLRSLQLFSYVALKKSKTCFIHVLSSGRHITTDAT